jgi:hypothetical protein
MEQPNEDKEGSVGKNNLSKVYMCHLKAIEEPRYNARHPIDRRSKKNNSTHGPTNGSKTATRRITLLATSQPT